MTNPYTILKDIYPKKSHSVFSTPKDPISSDRLQTIKSYVPENSLVIHFWSKENRGFVNLYDVVQYDTSIKKTLIFLAHHDINNDNPGVENCIDNTGSVSILLALANRLRDKNPMVNIIMAYTDNEEMAVPSLAGSKELADKITSGVWGDLLDIETINLEVSVRGKIKFVDNSDGLLWGHPDFFPVDTPYSDSYVLNKYGVTSSCIGIITEEDKKQIVKNGSCDTWRACHTKEDKFEKASEEDMNEFCDYLEQFVLSY